MIHSIAVAVSTDHVFAATDCIQHWWICEASTKQSCGRFYILVIICMWPSGFRTAPRVALKILKPWNAQSPAHSLPPGKASEDPSVSQPVCHPALSSSPPDSNKNCVLSCTHDDDVYEHSCASISVSLYVAPLLPTDGNLRHNAGGLSFEAPSSAHSPPPVLSSLSFSPLLPPFSPQPFALTKQKEKLQSYAGRPQNLAAGGGSLPLLLWRDKSSPAFDTITQTERGRKRRCNIHMKITRLAAM